MQTVQGFQQGGSVYAGQPSMITSIMDFIRTGDAQSGIGQIQEENAMRRVGLTPDDLRRVQAATAANQSANEGAALADVNRVQAATEANRIADAVQAAQSQPVPTGDLSSAVQNIQGQLSDIGALMTPEQRAASEARMNMLSEAQSGRLAEDVFGQGYGMPRDQTPFMMPGVTTSPAQEAEAAAATPESETAVFAGDQQAKDVEAAKRGELGAAEQVKAVVQQGTPEEREQNLTQLMNEFKQNAPEYKGMDRGLAIAKIGFAMAAGQDPRAIVNISKALSDGADMMIRDEKERAAFQRQVDLSALQYGLGEIGKQRAQQRLDERTFTDFVDSETGESVRVSNADYFANGNKLPEGLMDKALYTRIQTAIYDKEKAALELIKDAENRKYLTSKEVTSYRKDYSSLVKKASEAETAGAFLERVISSAAEGQITGPYAAAKSATAKFAAIFGVDVPQSFTNRDRAVQDLQAALQSVVDVTLGETQSANSISDRDVNLLIRGFLADGIMQENADGVLNFVAVPEEVFINSLQNGLRQVRRAQAETLNEITAIESELADLYTPAGKGATTLIDPFKRDRASSLPAQGSMTLELDTKTGQYFVPGT